MRRFLSICLSVSLMLGLLSTNLGIVITTQAASILSYIVNPFSTPDWIGEANYEGDNFAAAVATAGDVNGDGYADVVIGAPYYTNGQLKEGRAYLYLGSATGLASTPAWTFENNIENCELGQKVASVGDVNKDGYDDVMIGSEYCPNVAQPDHREGRVYLFLGSSSGLPASYSWTKVGGTFDEGLGWSIASAGDVNNDGYGDVIIGAPWASYPEGHEGRAYVFYGSASGLAANADWIAESNDAWTDFGAWVDSAGDVNGDGYDDVVIGHPGWSSPENNEGRAYVFLGSGSGLLHTASWTYENNHDESELGFSVAGAGDINGDGYDDVIVGANKYANPDAFEGIAYLFHGSATGLSSSPAWSREGNQAYAQYSRTVESAGDVNDDGFDDVIIGAPWYNGGTVDEGKVFLYFGSPGGLLSEPVFSVESNQEYAILGWSIGSAGDVNGDSIDDIIVGARNYSGGQGGEGRATVYYGSDDAASRTLLPMVIK